MIVHVKCRTVSRVFEKEGDREWGVGRNAVPLGKWVEEGHVWPRKTPRARGRARIYCKDKD